MSAYYSNQQPPSPGSPSPPNGSASSMAAAAAAALHWNPFSEFSPYYLPNHNNINSRYQHHLQGYHPHHNHHLSNYSNHPHHHQGTFPTPHGQPLFGTALSSSQHQPSVSPTNFPSDVKPDPNVDDRNQNYVRGSREPFSESNGILSNSSTDAKTSSSTTTPHLASIPYLPQQQQQQQHLLPTHHQVTNNNTTLGHLQSCSETNNPSNVREFGLSEVTSPLQQQQQQQQQQNPLAVHQQLSGSSPNFNCLSPTSLAMTGSDPAAAMAAMTASQGGYYDMYGSGGGGSFGAKGSSFYPWMKNYSGKMEPSEKCLQLSWSFVFF